VNLHSIIQLKEWQTEPDLAAAPARILENPEAAMAALIKIPVAGPRAAAATMIIKTTVPVAVGLTPMDMANNCTNQGAIIAVESARKANKEGIPMTMTINCDLHIQEPA
jgi:uncharacterized membrane protein (DUF4010 family)